MTPLAHLMPSHVQTATVQWRNAEQQAGVTHQEMQQGRAEMLPHISPASAHGQLPCLKGTSRTARTQVAARQSYDVGGAMM